MLAFLIFAGLACLLVLGFVLRPLWVKAFSTNTASSTSTTPEAATQNTSTLASELQASSDHSARLAVYRDRKQEIEVEVGSGRMDTAEAARQQEELVQDVSREFVQIDQNQLSTPNNSAKKTNQSSLADQANPWAAATFALLGLGLAVGLYLSVGAPGLIDPSAQQAAVQELQNPEQLITSMQAKIKANPKDAQAWAVLAGAYKFSGQPIQAKEAFEAYFKLAPPNGPEAARPLAEFAEVLAVSNNNDFTGRPLELLTQALQLSPDEPKSLAMMGAAQFRAGNFLLARKYLGQLVAQMPPDSPQAKQLQPVLDRINTQIESQLQSSALNTQATSPSPSAVNSDPVGKSLFEAELSIPPDKQVQVTQDVKAIFISVRPAPSDGSAPRGMPLAAVKLDGATIKQWPLRFSLSDAQSLNPQAPLSKAGVVVIEAHLSRSGQAGKQSGDWFARRGEVQVKAGSSQVLKLSVDQQQP